MIIVMYAHTHSSFSIIIFSAVNNETQHNMLYLFFRWLCMLMILSFYY